MYQPYGIGFSRGLLIKCFNAKNVIYWYDADGKMMNDNGLGCRFHKMDVDNYDYEYMREWRTPERVFNELIARNLKKLIGV